MTSEPSRTEALTSDKLRPACNTSNFTFITTDDIEPIDTLVGQDRALSAIRFGTKIDQPGYNMFVLGPQGTGRHTAVLSFLEKAASEAPAPDDWVGQPQLERRILVFCNADIAARRVALCRQL